MYTEQEAKELVILAGKKLLESGLIARTWGNISARISKTQFVITPSGKGYETLLPDEIVVVNIADCTYEGNVKPSSEKGVHADAYRLRENVNFVIHTHQINASAVSILGKDITDLNRYGDCYEQVLGKMIPCAEYGLSSTEKLKKAVASQVQKHSDCSAILMKHHGALCMGYDFDNAFAVSAALEEVCGKYYQDICHFEYKEKEQNSKYGNSTRKGNEITFCCGDRNTTFNLQALTADLPPEARIHAAIYQDKTINSIIHVQTPYIFAISEKGKTIRPYLDDQAQIAGVSVKCVHDNLGIVDKTVKALKSRNAVLLKNNGAICTGGTLEDAEAVGMVLEKGAQAALLSQYDKNAKPVNRWDAFKERLFYVKSYSKLKNS